MDILDKQEYWIAALVTGFLFFALALSLLFVYKYRTNIDPQPFPRRIFQTWKNHTPPPNMNYWSRTWITFNPSYVYELWDDAQNRAFVVEHYPWFLPTYDGYDREIKRADSIRYMYLHKYGGIYADMDFECLQSFEPLLRALETECNILLGSMDSKAHLDMHSIPNALIISKPGQDFWLSLLHKMQEVAKDSALGVEAMTGPIVLKKMVERDWFGSHGIKIVDPGHFYPISWNVQNEERLEALGKKNYQELSAEMRRRYPEAYAITYWTHSW